MKNTSAVFAETPVTDPRPTAAVSAGLRSRRRKKLIARGDVNNVNPRWPVGCLRSAPPDPGDGVVDFRQHYVDVAPGFAFRIWPTVPKTARPSELAIHRIKPKIFKSPLVTNHAASPAIVRIRKRRLQKTSA